MEGFTQTPKRVGCYPVLNTMYICKAENYTHHKLFHFFGFIHSTSKSRQLLSLDYTSEFMVSVELALAKR